MPLPADNIGKSIMFSGCPSAVFVHSFVRPDRTVTTISHEQLEQSRWHLQGIFASTPIDDLIRLWRSKIEVTTGCGKDTHVDARALKSHLVFFQWSSTGSCYRTLHWWSFI